MLKIEKWINERIDPKMSKILSVVIFLLIPAFILFCVEFIQRRGDLLFTLKWFVRNITQVGLNYMMILSSSTLLYSLIGCLFLSSAIVSVIFLFFSIVSYYKLSILGLPLLPWDLMIKKEGLDMTRLILDKKGIILILSILMIFTVIWALRRFFAQPRTPIYYRLPLTLIALLFFFVVTYQPTIGESTIYQKLKIGSIKWAQDQNYQKNGAILAFTMNIKDIIYSKPDGYSQDAVATINKEANETSKDVQVVSENKQPNVIIVMNEAFWDPTVLPNITFSQDPIPTFRELQKNHTSGWLLSPQFGGGTSNVEFEVLTGNSTSLLPTGSIPYQQHIKGPMTSLASIFRDQGYRSIGIHPYEKWFWNRETVYELLGFQEFKSLDNFKDAQTRGLFVSDNEVSKSIIDEIEKTKNPMFIYAVTMQNHGPYDDNRYGENQIKAEGSLVSSSKNILETYTQGAYDADQSLKTLVEHFEKSEEPTVVVFFGDHLPMLGYNFTVFAESNFIQSGDPKQWSLEELMKMRSVPVVVWSNFEHEKEDINHLSTSFLGSYLLDFIGQDKPDYLKFGQHISKSFPGMIDGLKIDNNGNLFVDFPDNMKHLEEKYWLMQYDKMFGKNYLENNNN